MLSRSDDQESCLPAANGSNFNRHLHRKCISQKMYPLAAYHAQETEMRDATLRGRKIKGRLSLRWGKAALAQLPRSTGGREARANKPTEAVAH